MPPEIHQEMAAAEPLLQPNDRRSFFVDALNVAYWSGKPPSLRVPLALMTALLADGHQVVTYFDASAPYQLKDEADLYAGLMQHPAHFIKVRSGIPADRVMLRHATSRGACILSRDKYGDHRRRHRKLIDDPTRLLAGGVRDGRIRVPALALDVPLPASAGEAWEQLKPLLLATSAGVAGA